MFLCHSQKSIEKDIKSRNWSQKSTNVQMSCYRGDYAVFYGATFRRNFLTRLAGAKKGKLNETEFQYYVEIS